MATAVLIGVYGVIVYLFFKLGQFYEKYKQRKEEQVKMWAALSNGYVPKCDDPVNSTTYKAAPRRKYRK